MRAESPRQVVEHDLRRGSLCVPVTIGEPAGTSPPTHYARAADVMATGSERSQLIYVHYDDRLSDGQMDNTLAGDWDAAKDDVLERFDEHAYTRARKEAEELVNAAFEAGISPYKIDELDGDDLAEAIEAIREIDSPGSESKPRPIVCTPNFLQRAIPPVMI